MTDFLILLPETYLFLTVLGVLISEAGYFGERTRLVHWIAWIGLAGAFLQNILNYRLGTRFMMDRTLISDGFTLFLKSILILVAFLSIFTSLKSREIYIRLRSEFIAFSLGITAVMMLAVSGIHLMVVWVAIAMTMILSAIWLGFKVHCEKAIEASYKAWVNAVIGSLCLLFGFLLVFAHTKSFFLLDLHKALQIQPMPAGLSAAVFLFFLGGFCSFVGAFPFHFWGVDAWDGAAGPIAGVLGVGLRVTGFGVLARLIFCLFSEWKEADGVFQAATPYAWAGIVSLFAGATILFTGLLSLRQNRIRRLLACLWVMQSGYLLLGLISQDPVGLSALLFQLFHDALAWLAIYASVSYLEDRIESDRFEDFRGVLYRSPVVTLCLVFSLFSIAGIPPLPGFFGKLFLVLGVMKHEWNLLVIVALFGTFLTLVSITRFLNEAMSRRGAKTTSLSIDPWNIWLVVCLTAPLAIFSGISNWILNLTSRSVHIIFW